MENQNDGGVAEKRGVDLFQGAFAEQIDDAFDRVMENINDINTDPDAVRSITAEIKIKPIDRRTMETNMTIKVKLAQYPGVKGAITAKYKDGKAILYEAVPNQMPMEFKTVPMKVKTGEKGKK